jgi:hypothetical protein
MWVRRRDAVEQVIQRAGGQGMHKIRRDLHTRLEHEPPSGHPWMGQRQRCSVENQIVVEQQVEIDRPGPPALAALAVESVLHRREHAEHIMRGQISLEETGTVEKHALSRRTADRTRVAVAAHTHERDARHVPQQFHRPIEIIASFADVGPTSDKASCHSVSYQEAKHADSTRRPPSRKNATAKTGHQTRKYPPDNPPNHRSKPGGHPGHDQSRRLSLPPVVAPEIFETIVRQVFVNTHQGPRSRDLRVCESQSPDGGSFCDANRRCQGRFATIGVHANEGARNRRRTSLFLPQKFFASGASIVETVSTWCACSPQNSADAPVDRIQKWPDDVFFLQQRRWSR